MYMHMLWPYRANLQVCVYASSSAGNTNQSTYLPQTVLPNLYPTPTYKSTYQPSACVTSRKATCTHNQQDHPLLHPDWNQTWQQDNPA